MLSQTSEHAIRALLYLAGRPASGAVSADEIATAIGAPRNYLAKTLNALAHRGLLSAVRGRGGGFMLEVDPSSLPIARIMELFEPAPERPLCLLGGRRCDARRPCDAHARWTAMWRESMAPLETTTLGDLLSDAPAMSDGLSGRACYAQSTS
ncbi:MAG TPA: Rrf2 family transcriptional regulator [Longimicrobiaceae bacterium]